MPDIALVGINARFSHSNLAIRYLRNSLNKANFSAEIFDFNINQRKEEILRELYFCNTSCYGFSAYIWNLEICLDIARNLKKLKECKIIFGGAQMYGCQKDFLEKYSFIDTVVSGEGEKAIVDVLKENITGIYNAQAQNFKEIPFAYIEEDKESTKNKMLYYESSRGCPYRCSFCLSGDNVKVRAKDIETVKEEIAKLLEFSPHTVKIVDRTFNFDRKRAYELIKFFGELDTEAVFHLEICAELLQDEDFELLKKVPKNRIQLEIGVQSTNKKTLEAINRNPVTINKLEKLKELENIHIHLDLIAGLPYEDINSFKQSFNDIFPYASMLQLGFLKVLPSTQIKREAEKYGIVSNEKPPYEVLKTNYLSYEDVTRLKEIEECLERFHNSESFKRSLEYVIKYFPTPYDFFYEFSLFLKENKGLFESRTKKDDFYMLYDFMKRLGCESNAFEALKYDFTVLFRGYDSHFEYNYPQDFKIKCTELFNNEEFIEKYLCEYKGQSAKNINKYCDIHIFNICEYSVLLFERNNGKIIEVTKFF